MTNLHISETPKATLAQLQLENANFGFEFTPRFCAMDDGIDHPAGCWRLFEERPVFNPQTLSWESDGAEWEVGLDPTDDLRDTPAFQRWVKPGFSLLEVVEATDAEPAYHPLAYGPRP
ncbi:hypothetical protein [Stutzerimonas stutzeri]|uniref:hypothetical protein n=1 Tax=Stutzerimonas stutzeri TaxID=316 RepID=UPI00265D49B7|nr:hypothetical protein [Stutzerimonas stutzeri]MCF6783726.1 hypothetical protein [Stutzerimonas stutzeri]